MYGSRVDCARKIAQCIGALVLLVPAFVTHAQPARDKSDEGYVTDNRGQHVRNATYLCWHTGYWTPAAAVAECDPDLMPKPPPAASKPPPAVLPSPQAQAAPPTPKPKPAPATGAPVLQKLTLSAETLFDFDKSVLKQQGRQRLDELATTLATMNVDAVIAVGHTDSIGSDAYNQKLSLRRARAVRDYLASRGVAADRITAEGKGERQPVAGNSTRQGRAKNRRVEIEVVGTKR
jgi:OmpA-OmpF porin, OOP family